MRILITAGPTREYIDSVRFLSNASSGQMGYAIAVAAQARGHEVVLISGPVVLPPPVANVIRVESAAEMLQAAEAEFCSCDAAVMTAAVADFRPVQRLESKAPKPAGTWDLKLEPTPDICAALGAVKQQRVVVGFALQDDDAHFRAEQKLMHKRCDAIVLNGPQTLGSPRTRQQIKVAGELWREPLEASKSEAAERVIALVEELVARSAPRG